MLSDQEMFQRMERGWRGGLHDGTICGFGSTMESTKRARAWLPEVCRRYGIKTLNDAGAGDLTWIRKVEWDVDYMPFDLIPRLPEIVKWDITTEALPAADAILCRHVLNHIQDRVEQTLALFRESARYLIATQFNHSDGGAREFERLDLREFLGKPLESIEDGGAEYCRLALWRLI